MIEPQEILQLKFILFKSHQFSQYQYSIYSQSGRANHLF